MLISKKYYDSFKTEGVTDIKKREIELRAEIEKDGDPGGDLYLELADCLIAQEKFDEACEKLLICLDKDTEIRDLSVLTIVDLLAEGLCLKKIPFLTYDWICSACYIEPDKKKKMYLGIAGAAAGDYDRISGVVERYINDFGADEKILPIFEKQFHSEDGIEAYVYDLVVKAILSSKDSNLLFKLLADSTVEYMYEHAGDIHDESYNVAFEIVKYALENDLDFSVYLNSDKELNDRSLNDNHNTMTMAVDYFVMVRNYRVLAKLFSDFVFVSENCPDDWIATESNEKVYGPIIDCVIASCDLRIVSDFICETNFECSWNLSGEHYRKIQELVLQNYFKDGIVRSEWEKLDPNFMEEAFQYIVEEVFFAADMYDDDDYIDGEYKNYDPRIIKKAFEACGHIFSEEDFCGEWAERDNKTCFLSPYLNVIFYVADNEREAWKEKVNAILAKVKETYDI